MQNVEIYDKRLLDFNDAYSPIEVIAADQKRLIVDAFVRYRITDPLKFKQTVGDERNIKSRLKVILEANLRQVIGGVPLTDVVSGKRAVLMRQIRDLVNAQAKGGPEGGFGIEVVDVRIQRADLPEANSEGIYHRMQTERERDAKQFRANGAQDAQEIRSKAEKERTILLAERGRIRMCCAARATPRPRASSLLPPAPTRNSTSFTAPCRPTAKRCPRMTPRSSSRRTMPSSSYWKREEAGRNEEKYALD